MKYLLLFVSLQVNAATYTFWYKDTDLKVTASGDTYDIAYRKAAKLCFQALTKGKYPGDEAGLDIIDVCANPIKHIVKEF